MTVLKGIPRILPPRLLYVLASMGHGDELVLADANFPSASVAREHNQAELISCDSLTLPELLQAICQLLPLDTYVEFPAAVMQVVPQDSDDSVRVVTLATPIWDEFRSILQNSEGRNIELEQVERFAFYERAKRAYAVVSTGESALYGNLILKKGVLGPVMAENDTAYTDAEDGESNIDC